MKQHREKHEFYLAHYAADTMVLLLFILLGGKYLQRDCQHIDQCWRPPSATVIASCLSAVRWAVVRMLGSITEIKFYALEESEYNFPNRQPLKFPTKWFRVEARPMAPTAMPSINTASPPSACRRNPSTPRAPSPTWILISFLVFILLPHLGSSNEINSLL